MHYIVQYTYIYRGLLTQFCTAGLQDSSPEEHKMHQISWAGALPRTPLEAQSVPANPLADGEGR